MVDSLTVLTSKKIINLPKYISTHIVLLHLIKQYLIIVSTTSSNFIPATVLLRSASLLNKIRFNNYNDSYPASLFHVVHLIHLFFPDTTKVC